MTRAAFVTVGSFSGINDCVLDHLKREFPDIEWEFVDVRRWVRSHRVLLSANLLAVLAEEGPSVFLNRRRLWGAFYRTSLIFNQIRRALQRRVSNGDFLFTLQTQSLFDASVPGIPHFVYTDHTELVRRRYLDYDPALAQPERWLNLERQIFERAHVVFTMSAHVSASLVEQYHLPHDRVVCVGAGGNVTDDEPDPQEPDYASRKILFVGRDWDRKGGADLIAAFRLVREQISDASLVIVGCSPTLDEPGVTVLGQLSAEEVRRQYAEAAVFCLPTLVEPFGIVFVEALAHGLPVVATAIGAVPDIVQDGETGFLHEPHDVDGLAGSLRLLLEDPARCRRMGASGRAFVQGRYTWSRAVGRMAQEIRASVADGDRSAGGETRGAHHSPRRGQRYRRVAKRIRSRP